MSKTDSGGDMRVLIAGAGGAIGQLLTPLMLNVGYQVSTRNKRRSAMIKAIDNIGVVTSHLQRSVAFFTRTAIRKDFRERAQMSV
jgi:GDP-D-mannose dehydratase